MMATKCLPVRLRRPFAFLITERVDIASLAAFRIGFGLIMFAAMIRFLLKGWVHELYFVPRFLFTYPGFGWVRPLPEPFMHAHFIFLALLALGIALGFFYRVCISLFFVGFTYVELLDRTAYLNHYYLISLLSLLLIFLSANRLWSLDALRHPNLRLQTVPAWAPNILGFQIAIVYVYAGIAKLNSDWLLHAQPLRIWLAARSDLPLIGSLFEHAWVAFVASWLGALFDLTIVFFLLSARTRSAAYACLVVFHLATAALFNIGMFPWIMIVAALIFFPPNWPRACLKWLKRWRPKAAEIDVPVDCPSIAAPLSRPLAGVLVFYAMLQLLLPLRPYLLSENPAWTRSGFDFAWHVMVAEKTGYVEFYAQDPATGRRWKLSTRNWLVPRQESLMAQDPYLIRAMARHLSAELKRQGHEKIEIRAEAYAALNGHPGQHLIKPTLDLAGELPVDWIVPLRAPKTEGYLQNASVGRASSRAASRDGAPSPSANQGPRPFHGCLFKILTRQGRNAPGGKYDYIINGNMIGGFALLAWPAEYGDSGIMTFMVSHQGRVYQKDLGTDTAKVVRKITAYDPDATWRPSAD